MLFRFDTFSVSIAAKPKTVYDFVADLHNWKQFSDFCKNIERVNEMEWVTHTSQGNVRIIPQFDSEKMLLDSTCVLANGDKQFIPYRVVPNGDGAELIMTNQQTASVSAKEYREQISWMKTELQMIKKILESL